MKWKNQLIEVVVQRVGPRKWSLEGGRKGGGPKGKGWGAGLKISRFFPLPPQNSFLFSLWGSSRVILVVFEVPEREGGLRGQA